MHGRGARRCSAGSVHRKGFAATRLEDVAKRAGVSKGTLYLYFDSKEDLLKAAIREGYAEPLRHGEQVLASLRRQL